MRNTNVISAKQNLSIGQISDEQELQLLKQERDEILKRSVELTAGGTKPPTTEVDLLQMEFAKVDQEIRHMLLKMERNEPKAPETHLYDMAKGLYTGKTSDLEQRGFTFTNGTATYLSPQGINPDVAYLLRANNPLVALGAQMFAFQNNRQRLPYESTGAVVQWLSHGSSVTEDTALTFLSRDTNMKHAAILVKAHRHWLEDSDDSIGRNGFAGAMLENAMASAMNEAVVKVALTGSTGAGQPEGLDNMSGIQTVAGGGAVLANYDLFIDAIKKLLLVNVPLENIGMILSPEVWAQIGKLKDAEDRYLAMPEALESIQYFVTSAALQSYSGGTRTRAYVGDFRSLMMAFHGGPSLTILNERYAEEFNVGFILSMRMDLQSVRRDNFCIITDILNA